MRKLWTLIGVVTVAILFIWLYPRRESSTTHKLRVGLVMSTAGRGDMSFNDSLYDGLERVREELDVSTAFVEPKEITDFYIGLTSFAANNFDLVIAAGYQLVDACKKAATEFPNTTFVMFDDVVDLPNVTSVLFEQKEGAFLAGALAARMTKTGVVGFVGGNESHVIKAFKTGFEEGVEHYSKEIRDGIGVRSIIIGGGNPFNDPIAGQNAATSLISLGADVLFHAAAGSGLGVITEAREAGIYAIGVDLDQSQHGVHTVLTSVLKRLDIAIFEVVYAKLYGKLKSGTITFGVDENDGVALAPYKKEMKDIIPAKVREEVAALIAQMKEKTLIIE